jgi:hypothetical protein
VVSKCEIAIPFYLWEKERENGKTGNVEREKAFTISNGNENELCARG